MNRMYLPHNSYVEAPILNVATQAYLGDIVCLVLDYQNKVNIALT